MSMPRLCILCPMYNEEHVVSIFFQRILPVIETLSKRYSVDLVFLNNASSDSSLREVMKLRHRLSSVYVITMSRNMGVQRSLDCGLRNVKGDLFAIIDVDGEDPPEMLLEFVARYEQGFDIVYGIRAHRHGSLAINLVCKLFYRILKTVADEQVILDMSEFSLFSSEVRDSILAENNSFPYMRASIARVGFKRIGISYRRLPRIGGKSHYNLPRLFTIATAGILSSSTLPLRIPLYLLPFWLFGIVLVGSRYATTGSRGYLVAELILIAGYLGSSIAFIALYLARTYKNGLRRPNAFVHLEHSLRQDDIHPIGPSEMIGAASHGDALARAV